MSNALKAVAGIALIAAGAYLDAITWGSFGAVGNIMISAGAGLLLNSAASLFIKAPRASPLAGVAINYSGTLEARRILYGTMKIGGMNALPPITSGPSHDFADIEIALTS